MSKRPRRPNWRVNRIDMSARLYPVEPVPRQRLFRVSQAAEYLGISDDTLRKRADMGEIPVYRDHGQRVFKLEDLNQLIDTLPLWNDRNHDESRAGRDREAS